MQPWLIKVVKVEIKVSFSRDFHVVGCSSHSPVVLSLTRLHMHMRKLLSGNCGWLRPNVQSRFKSASLNTPTYFWVAELRNEKLTKQNAQNCLHHKEISSLVDCWKKKATFEWEVNGKRTFLSSSASLWSPTCILSQTAAAMCCSVYVLSGLIINSCTFSQDTHDLTQNHNQNNIFHINGKSVCPEDNQDTDVNSKDVIWGS